MIEQKQLEASIAKAVADVRANNPLAGSITNTVTMQPTAITLHVCAWYTLRCITNSLFATAATFFFSSFTTLASRPIASFIASTYALSTSLFTTSVSVLFNFSLTTRIFVFVLL